MRLGVEGLCQAQILEVTPTATTYLADKAAARIRADLAKALAASSYDSYSWDELEEMGAHNIQDLALPVDGPKGPGHVGSEFAIDDDLRVGLIDIPASARNWPKRSLRVQAALARGEAPADRALRITHARRNDERPLAGPFGYDLGEATTCSASSSASARPPGASPAAGSDPGSRAAASPNRAG